MLRSFWARCCRALRTQRREGRRRPIASFTRPDRRFWRVASRWRCCRYVQLKPPQRVSGGKDLGCRSEPVPDRATCATCTTAKALAWLGVAGTDLVDLREDVEHSMTKPFAGRIEVDIRDSEEDWSPFEPRRAPDGSPNVVYIVLDDVGFSAMSSYGGPIETPNVDRIAADGVRYTQWHTTALCSPTRSCLLTGRNHTRNSMACITEAAI